MDLLLDFRIDQGQLNGYDPQRIFVMGFELGELWQLMQLEEVQGFEKMIRATNQARAVEAAGVAGFDVVLKMFHDDWVLACFTRKVLPSAEAEDSQDFN